MSTTTRIWESEIISERDVERNHYAIKLYHIPTSRRFESPRPPVGDLCLFYHSSAEETGVAGIAKVASAPYPDPTQFDKKSPYSDDASTKENPRWQLVDIAFVKKLPRVVTLAELKADSSLEGMMVRERGARLSVQPVSEKHFRYIAADPGGADKLRRAQTEGS